MLHELLLALVGCTGDVFVDKASEARLAAQPRGRAGVRLRDSEAPEDDEVEEDNGDENEIVEECTFRVAPDLTFISSSEREVLERLLRLGFYYRELDRFTLHLRNLSWIGPFYVDALKNGSSISRSLTRKPSIYQRSLANGIAEVLAIYRSAVLKVEQNILSDPVPVIAIVTKGLNQFDLILQPLYSIMSKVERQQLRGGQLLNLLHAKSHCGVPELQTCIQRLLWHAHQVMYSQLQAWMVYGLLQDQHEEFFINRCQDGDVERSPFDLVHGGDKARKTQLAEDPQLADWHIEFSVCMTAESILFVGKAVRVLRNPSASFKSQVAGSHQSESGFLDRKDGVAFSLPFMKESVLSSSGYQGPQLLPQEQADKIAALLKGLKEKPLFHRMSFEHAVDEIRTIAATHLWQLMVVHSDLLGHLKALKDYFLLAKGDFFQCFLEESRSLMRLPPRPSTAEADLKIPFQQAAIKTIGDDDKYFSRVSLRMPTIGNAAVSNLPGESTRQRPSADVNLGTTINSYGDAGSGYSNDGWDSIALDYSINWPLQLLFTKEVLAKYSRVFQYVLRLKRIQLELEKSWAEAMQHDRADAIEARKEPVSGSTAKQRRQQRMPMWRVRQHMAYLITNLQFYIQVDVIESQWNLLQERIQGSKDFTELARFHQEYLSALISQSFLDIGSVSRILDSIIKLCLQLGRVIEQQDGTLNTLELDRITEEFNKKSNSLYTILRSSKLAGSQRAPFLRQFLLRLNYNSFFEVTARGALNVIRPRPTSVLLT
ncbi:hypothetical protein O6H91_20G003500 [Diphasiastrum complanatum]|uniref:Uncharacterized protein n=1 Tax=Diphasiastrum complanatum TaxID=34168 RepID=A0ACC2AMA4_DIPCM|nr:hypothetical protein O6H91_20G003500 [Diphasiastrum complanatum]